MSTTQAAAGPQEAGCEDVFEYPTTADVHPAAYKSIKSGWRCAGCRTDFAFTLLEELAPDALA